MTSRLHVSHFTCKYMHKTYFRVDTGRNNSSAKRNATILPEMLNLMRNSDKNDNLIYTFEITARSHGGILIQPFSAKMHAKYLF